MGSIYKVYLGTKLGSVSSSHGVQLPDSRIEYVIESALEEVGQDSATISEAVGYWKGKKEKTIVLEFITHSGNDVEVEGKLSKLADIFTERLGQDSVLYTKASLDYQVFTVNPKLYEQDKSDQS